MNSPQPQSSSSEDPSARVVLAFLGVLVSGALFLMRVCSMGGGEPVGSGCEDSSDCAGSAVCIQSGLLPLGTCTETCRSDDDCSFDRQCRRVDGGSISVCALRPSRQFGEHCTAGNECVGEVCLISMQRIPFNGYCSSRCTWQHECPDGALCHDGSCVRVEWLRPTSTGAQPASTDSVDELAGAATDP